MGNHEKLYGICENKCLVEVAPKRALDWEFVASIPFEESYTYRNNDFNDYEYLLRYSPNENFLTGTIYATKFNPNIENMQDRIFHTGNGTELQLVIDKAYVNGIMINIRHNSDGRKISGELYRRPITEHLLSES